MTIPTPGSDAAVAQGCRCARMDNHYGRGVEYRNQETGEMHTLFWISEDCPLHGVKEDE